MKWLTKLLFVVVLFAALGALIGGLASRRSYVLLSVGNSVLETSLWFAVLAVLSLVLVVGGGVFLLFKGVKTGRYALNWRQERRVRAAVKQSKEGFLQLAQGHWAQAEALLKASFANDSHALLGYIGAARAANEQGKNDTRDAYLQQAKDRNPDAAVSLTIARAAMQSERGQYKQVIETLSKLEGAAAQQNYVLALLHKAYEATNDWSALRDLLPLLQQHQVLDADALSRLEKTVFCQLMEAVSRKPSPEEDKAPYVNDLIRLWEDASAALRGNASFLAVYARALLALKQNEQAVKLLLREMPKLWSDELLVLYGQVQGEHALMQLEKAEAWLPSHPNNEELLLALGRLAYAAKSYDKSRHYLEKALEINKSPAIYAELGRLYCVLGDDKSANQAFVSALALNPSINA